MFVLIVGRDLQRSADLSETLANLGLDWTVQWTGEPSEAQALLEGQGVDVVAVDGGEARGVDVLRRAREKNPTAVRLLLLPPGCFAVLPLILALRTEQPVAVRQRAMASLGQTLAGQMLTLQGLAGTRNRNLLS